MRSVATDRGLSERSCRHISDNSQIDQNYFICINFVGRSLTKRGVSGFLQESEWLEVRVVLFKIDADRRFGIWIIA